jgi:uncharacterized membrane protein AbrB (regulator of aidB expression)
MELKGFDNKKPSPLLTIGGAILALLVAFWVIRRIVGALFRVAIIVIAIALVALAVGSIVRWFNKQKKK